MSSYSDRLKNPLWQKKRLEIFQRDNFKCVSCGREDLELHVHHLEYKSNMMPWEYENHYLITYCEICHNSEHMLGDGNREYFLKVIKSKPLFIDPLAKLCLLTDQYPPFLDHLKAFLKEEMKRYLQHIENCQKHY